MKKKNNKILITKQLLKALRSLFLEGKRTWNCRAFQNFFVVDHLGRIAGCHNHNFAGSVFDLPKIWNSEKFNLLRKTYKDCAQCAYLCYIFYSLHGGPYGNLLLAKDQWKNAMFFLRQIVPNLEAWQKFDNLCDCLNQRNIKFLFIFYVFNENKMHQVYVHFGNTPLSSGNPRLLAFFVQERPVRTILSITLQRT